MEQRALVLPPAQKTLAKSLVEIHSKDSTGFDDFVKGKGRGLIINLFGNPGVGKSLTAEATSERESLYLLRDWKRLMVLNRR